MGGGLLLVLLWLLLFIISYLGNFIGRRKDFGVAAAGGKGARVFGGGFAPFEREPGMDLGAFAFAGDVFEAAAGEGGALFHAQQAKALAANGLLTMHGDIETDAVIAHAQMKGPLVSLQFERDAAGMGMADDVGEGFLGDAEAFGFDRGIHAAFEGIGAEAGFETGGSGLAIEVPAQGGFEAEVVEHGRTKIEREVVNLFEDLLDGVHAFLDAM